MWGNEFRDSRNYNIEPIRAGMGTEHKSWSSKVQKFEFTQKNQSSLVLEFEFTQNIRVR